MWVYNGTHGCSIITISGKGKEDMFAVYLTKALNSPERVDEDMI